MKDRIANVWAKCADWPESEAERDLLASRLLGACIVASLDGWLEPALDRLHNPQSPEWRQQNGGPQAWARDRELREHLGSLTPEQKRAVETLLAGTLSGTLHSLLTKLDQFPAGTAAYPDAVLELVVQEGDGETEIASVSAGELFDLHDRLAGWIEEFSEYARLLRDSR